MSYSHAIAAPVVESHMYLSVRTAHQLLGMSVKYVRDVLNEQDITPIPLAPPEVVGALNLRGRIVTVIDLRCLLGLPPREKGLQNIFVIVDIRGELYCLQVDGVSEVVTALPESVEKIPANLDDWWKAIATGIYKLEDELLVLVDVQELLG